MLTLEPNVFERHYMDFVDQKALAIELTELTNGNKLIESFAHTLKHEGLLASFDNFLILLKQEDEKVIDALGLDREYHDLKPNLRTTIDMLFALNEIYNKLNQVTHFSLVTFDMIPVEKAASVLGVVEITTPYSFGYCESFFALPC